MIIPILFNIITLIILLCIAIVYSIVFLICQLKKYGKRGHLQNKIMVYLFLFVCGNLIFYLLDIHQYFYSAVGVYVYPHTFLPFNSHIEKWDHEGYYIFPIDFFSNKSSKTQCISTGCNETFSQYTMHDSIWEHYAVYQSLSCTTYDNDTIYNIPMKTILSYGFNRTDLVMHIQDTTGCQYWVRVLPDAFQHYQNNKFCHTDLRSSLVLKHRYLLLSEDDIPKECYHWINLYSDSLGLNICHCSLEFLWFFLILAFLPIVNLLLLINTIRLAYQRYKHSYKPIQSDTLE